LGGSVIRKEGKKGGKTYGKAGRKRRPDDKG
jgi:hypothetical protein